MDNKEIDFKRVAEQLRKGEPLFGKDGALAPMLERILNAALEGEMDAHLSIDERSKGNRHNGKLPKQVQTCYGEVTVKTPRDRDGSFGASDRQKARNNPCRRYGGSDYKHVCFCYKHSRYQQVFRALTQLKVHYRQ